MANTGILSWQNETGLINYPLIGQVGVSNFIVDANFIQFDNYIPTLNTVVVTSADIKLTITFDLEVVTITVLNLGFVDGHVEKIYGTSGRYLGKIIFGTGAFTLWNNFNNQTITVNVPFVSTVVQSIPTTAGVYSIDGVIGDVVIGLDTNMFVGQTGQLLVLNSVGLPTTGSSPALKTINGVAPINNNIYIEDSDLIKIGTTSNTVVNFSTVVSDLTTVSNILPAS